MSLLEPGGKIDPEITRAALLKWEIDDLGLDKMDRKYLETLIGVFQGGPAGVEAIAHTINTSSDTLIDEVEPFLLRTAMVVRTASRPELRLKEHSITWECRANLLILTTNQPEMITMHYLRNNL